MRPLLARAARGRLRPAPSRAVRTLRRGGGIGAGLPGRRMSRNARTLLGALVALAVLAADQASKYWVLNVIHLPDVGQIRLAPVLNLTMVWNRGVTFGMLNGLGASSHVVLAVLALAVVGILAFWLRRADSSVVAAALGAIAGGAVGNVIDRLRFGAVVDFIHAHLGGWSWYVFNVADAAIVCGVAALLLEGLLPRRGGRIALPAAHPAVKDVPHVENR